MYMAIACEAFKHPQNRSDYKVWYLEIDAGGNVVGIGVKTREQVVESIFNQIRRTGVSNWRAFRKNADKSTTIEVYDFISQNMHENTHFGNLPTLSEFHETLEYLKMNFELRAIAS
ncbi:MAG: hypothetical protein HN509_18060 [Halobacteriovoraceae bacterium]|jgi:hypothetical protein|nr:hypothetical protein [Halobacteriovoraceae bacterium]MBT5093419.1 hypothetical protein [Halobacteriovoraceae bacterium]